MCTFSKIKNHYTLLYPVPTLIKVERTFFFFARVHCPRVSAIIFLPDFPGLGFERKSILISDLLRLTFEY